MRKDGFSVLELLVTFIILGILAAIAIPGFSGMLPNYRLRRALRDVSSNFQLAKVSAIRRNSNCTVTFNQAIGATTYDYAVYVDSDKDEQYDVGEEVITKVVWAEYKSVGFDLTQGGGDGLTFSNNDDGLPSIGFLPNGLPVDASSGAVFLINSKNRTGNVAVSPVGNITVQ